jgi:predicted Rossmann fold nucleotide-binding protein DprA/Smf involved in DNA uptake
MIFAEMDQRSAIISEFPMGTFPAPQNFPTRNRIIAGMMLGQWWSRERNIVDH